VRPSQERDVVKRGLPGLGQQCPLLLKRDPGANLRSEIVRLVIGVLRSNGSGGSGAIVVRSSLVFLQQTLNLGLRISACPCQIFFCVVEFVLIEFELSLGNLELVAEIFLGTLGSGGELSCEAGDQILVGFYYGVGLARAVASRSASAKARSTS